MNDEFYVYTFHTTSPIQNYSVSNGTEECEIVNVEKIKISDYLKSHNYKVEFTKDSTPFSKSLFTKMGNDFISYVKEKIDIQNCIWICNASNTDFENFERDGIALIDGDLRKYKFKNNEDHKEENEIFDALEYANEKFESNYKGYKLDNYSDGFDISFQLGLDKKN